MSDFREVGPLPLRRCRPIALQPAFSYGALAVENSATRLLQGCLILGG